MRDAAIRLRSSPTSPEAFGEWVRPHLAAMARLAARLAPTAERDDIVQDALSRAWQKRGQFDPRRGAPSAWLLAITADQARKTSRRSRSVAPLGEHAARADPGDERIDVERAIAQLSARQRLAVDCYYFVGLSINETAVVMRCAEGTVKSTLADARDRLRSRLEIADA